MLPVKETLHIGVFGLNHNTAPLGIREKLYISETIAPELLQSLKHNGMEEIILLSTCNRTEIYYSCRDCEQALDAIRSALRDRFAVEGEWLDPYIYVLYDEDAYRHLFRVSSGLDSMMVGEPQILGQVKDAYRLATSHGATGSSPE